MQGNLVDRLIETIHTQCPAEAPDPSDPELRSFIATQLTLARDYGFRTDRDVVMFAFTGWLLGDGFDRNFPAIAECLATTDMTAPQKAEWIEAFSVTLLDTLAR